MPEQQQVITREEEPRPAGPVNAKERLYEKLRMPLWLLDTIIAALIVALVVFLVLGYLKGHGMM